MATWNIGKTLGNPGGFGQVYEVVLSDNSRKGALKKLHNPNTVNKQRFEREIKILQTLKHKHIIEIIEWNLNGQPPVVVGPYYIMEYMAGGDLRAVINDIIFSQKKIFSQKWCLEKIIFPVIEALEFAHSKETYHRDLKPENLLFTTTAHDHLKVADWGLGKDINKESLALTAGAGGLGGTTGYCSPEQWFYNNTIDGRTDIYSLGVIFYEMMTGKRPQVFNPLNGQQYIIAKPSSQNHSSIPAALDNAILKMLAYDIRNRYQSISQLKNDLSSIYQTLK